MAKSLWCGIVQVKSLYIGQRQGKDYFFASGLRVLFAAINFKPTISKKSIELLGYGYIPAPHTIFHQISKLCPGEILTFANGEVFSQTFWQPNEPRDLKIGLGRPCSETALSKLVAEQIETSIKQQMDVDVPFGAFLSGGLDSSTIVALMTKLSIKPIDTFSIGFRDQASDETVACGQVAGF